MSHLMPNTKNISMNQVFETLLFEVYGFLTGLSFHSTLLFLDHGELFVLYCINRQCRDQIISYIKRQKLNTELINNQILSYQLGNVNENNMLQFWHLHMEDIMERYSAQTLQCNHSILKRMFGNSILIPSGCTGNPTTTTFQIKTIIGSETYYATVCTIEYPVITYLNGRMIRSDMVIESCFEIRFFLHQYHNKLLFGHELLKNSFEEYLRSLIGSLDGFE